MTLFIIVELQGWEKKKHGPHSLRFSLASNMLKQGTSFQVISTVLGHSSTESTKAYVKIDIDRLRADVERAEARMDRLPTDSNKD